MSPLSNGKTQIQRLTFFPEFLSGIDFFFPPSYINPQGGSFFIFICILEVQRTPTPRDFMNISDLQISVAISAKHPSLKRFPSILQIVCEDTRKFHSFRCFEFLLGFQFSLRLSSRPSSSFQMGRFKDLVDTLATMEAFRTIYHIPQGVVLQYCPPEGVLTDKDVGQVVIPMIAFIEGGMTLPMRRITRDYLFHHRLTPHQCAPNMFRILGCVDVLNERMGLDLTWHDVVHLYECHYIEKGGIIFNLGPRSLG